VETVQDLKKLLEILMINKMDLSYKQKGSDVRYAPLKHYTMNDETVIAIYQGFRGENPDLDFIVKYKEPGKRLRTPSHTHWIVDLLVKCEHNKGLVRGFVYNMLEKYDQMNPFQTVEERNNYQLQSKGELDRVYDELNGHGYYNMDTLTAFIELFTRCEKQTTGAFMFKTLLQLVLDYCDGKKDFYQVVGYSKRV
jgi:hypothetical protein